MAKACPFSANRVFAGAAWIIAQIFALTPIRKDSTATLVRNRFKRFDGAPNRG
jgi:hypothetical protein